MEGYIPRLRRRYDDEAVKKLRTTFVHEPYVGSKLQKIVVSLSMKEAIQNKKLLESAVEEMTLLSGQKAVVTRARRSIANFKLREGMPIGARVTLRNQRMWEFLDRLVSVSIPRIRDRGIGPKGFDGRGNFSMGITEQIIFPEIEYDKVSRIHGMNITFVTSAPTDEEGQALLRYLGMPFTS